MMERRLRPVTAFVLTGTLALALAAPSAATPPVTPLQSGLRQIESGELEAGRAALRKEVEHYREGWRQAPPDGGPEGLGRRAGYARALYGTLQAWYTAEARALQDGNSADVASALALLDELLPLAREVAQARAGYRAEADALWVTLEPMERQRKYAGVFSDARFDDQDALPWSAARLAKLCGSEAHVERVFDSFGGRIGKQRDARAYFRAHEDFDDTLGLRKRDALRRAAARAAESGVQGPVLSNRDSTSDEDKQAIRELLARYYKAVIDRDADAVRACLAEGMAQTETILAGMQTTKTVAVGEIEALSFESGHGGAVRATVEKVSITLWKRGEEVTREGSQGFTVVEDGAGAWKIQEVAK